MSVDSGILQAMGQGPKPIAVTVSTDDVAALYACHTNPKQYMQLILAKLKDAGAPIEGMSTLRLAHGQVYKMKDNPLEERAEFTYLWLPEAYVAGLAQVAEA